MSEDIIRRRMQNTGETFEVAEANVIKAMQETVLDRNAAPVDWEKAWQEGGGDIPREALLDFFRTMPPETRALAQRFPPACLVRAREGRLLMCPAPGTVGIVRSYYEGTPERVTVAAHPESTFFAECHADWIEVVGYRGGFSREDVAGYLEEIAGEESGRKMSS